MVQIFNNKINCLIQIEESSEVLVTPHDYEESPYVLIEIFGFNFHHHSKNCKECSAFINAFGTSSLDWFITYMGKTKRLDLLMFSLDYTTNSSQFIVSETGKRKSVLKLILSSVPVTRHGIDKMIEKLIEEEQYERCALLRDASSIF